MPVKVLCAIVCLHMVTPSHVPAEGGKPVWGPEGSRPEGFDWIQLTNGEWLKGDKVFMETADGMVEFDRSSLVEMCTMTIWNQDLTKVTGW